MAAERVADGKQNMLNFDKALEKIAIERENKRRRD
jgi:hypothetical protein